MSLGRISARYAKSLIDLSSEQNKLERVKDDMEYFLAASEVRDLYLMLKSPIIHTATKRTIFRKLFSDRFDEVTSAFLDIILRKGRESYLVEIAEAFMDQYRIIRKISRVKLTTATELSAEKLDEIKNKILSAGVTLPNLELETSVDPEILGGFVLELGDKLYDASVSHQLEEMRRGFSKNTLNSFN